MVPANKITSYFNEPPRPLQEANTNVYANDLKQRISNLKSTILLAPALNEEPEEDFVGDTIVDQVILTRIKPFCSLNSVNNDRLLNYRMAA